MAATRGKQATERVVFTKNTILHSKKYAHRRDLLSVLLRDGQTYTMDQVDALITNFGER